MKKIFNLIDFNSEKKAAKIFNKMIFILIVINLIAIVVESYDGNSIKYKDLLYIIEITSITIFTIEYVLRVITSIYLTDENSNISKIIAYIISPIAIIDLLAILPFYIPFIIPIDLRFIRVLRIFRVFRVIKLNKYSSSLDLLFRVLNKEKSNLSVSFLMASILIFISATLMYYLESDIQPEYFSSIPATFWWAVNTLTTVGYGDVFPVTIGGKLLSGIISILGIGVVAIPTGIISSGFVSELNNISEDKTNK